jgi:hypothetical protein
LQERSIDEGDMARLIDLDALVIQFPLAPVKSDPLRYLFKRIANVQPKVSLRKKQSRGRSALSRERTEILHLPVTPTEWLPIAEKSIHRLLLN